MEENRMKKFLITASLLVLFSISCRQSTGLERDVHPDDWIKIHGEKIEREGTWACQRCHPPEGDFPDAPTCSNCHPENVP